MSPLTGLLRIRECGFLYTTTEPGGKRRWRARTPKPVGISFARLEREASWSAERKLRFGHPAGVAAQLEELCLSSGRRETQSKACRSGRKAVCLRCGCPRSPVALNLIDGIGPVRARLQKGDEMVADRHAGFGNPLNVDNGLGWGRSIVRQHCRTCKTPRKTVSYELVCSSPP